MYLRYGLTENCGPVTATYSIDPNSDGNIGGPLVNTGIIYKSWLRI